MTRFRGDKSAADKVYEGTRPLVAFDIAEEIVWAASRPPVRPFRRGFGRKLMLEFRRQHVNLAEVFVLPSCQAGPGQVARK